MTRRHPRLASMQEGHLRVGDVVQFGWPAGAGTALYTVLEVDRDAISDTHVCTPKGETFWFRSLGAVVVKRAEDV